MARTAKLFSAVVVTILGSVCASSAFAAGDAASGAKLFNQVCAMCHTTVKGGASLVGPNLFDVVGRKAGSLAGYSYSPALKAWGKIWNEDILTNWVTSPSTVVPNTRMIFNGIKKHEDAESVAAYLATLK